MAHRALKFALAGTLVIVVSTAMWCQQRPTVRPLEFGVSDEVLDVTIAGKVFHLEVALDSTSRHRGLSDRKSVATDGGMIFGFSEPQSLSFVMRRCLIPIDLIYLDGDGRVVNMHRMKVEPYNTADDDLHDYLSDGPAQFAIELSAGSIDRLGIEPGQRIELPLETLKRLAR